ncbi:thioredoxin-dependent thiol peroxidase [candidate division WOR-3 bacterium]|nr:thioredoxin-dependent thiol peroxidase [candidate division WOR-3 bacterium]
MIEIGKKAPDFTLKDESGEEVKLSDMKGKWVVLYFYPKDNTPGCTTEALQFTEHAADFAKMNARVLGISADSCESHQRFMVKHDLKVKLLSDPEHEVLEKYWAWGEKKMYGKTFLGIQRSTVLIDPEGKIALHWPNVKAKGHAAQVKEKLAEIQDK